MCGEPDNYASYLLRLRRSDRAGQPIWRASLESTRDGQRLEFGSVEALIAFLSARYGSAHPGAADGAQPLMSGPGVARGNLRAGAGGDTPPKETQCSAERRGSYRANARSEADVRIGKAYAYEAYAHEACAHERSLQ